MRLCVDEFEIDTDAFELRHGGKVVPTEPLVFDLICFLAENSGRLLTRDDLMNGVWDGRIVSDATVSGCIKAARQALGDSGADQKFIRTVRGRGFQFVKDVQRSNQTDINEVSGRSASAPSKMRQPSLIVLPFSVFGDDTELSALADGIVENLTTVLVRVPLLLLASRSTSFAYKGQSASAARIQQDLGVSYLLEGSVQRASGKIRVNIQLIETIEGFHLWAQQFDTDDGPSVLDDLLRQILPRLEVQLVRAMFNDLRETGGELSARQLLLKATGLLSLKGWHRQTFEEATELLRKVIAKEPELPLAHAHLAVLLALGHRVGLLEKSQAISNEALSEAETALELDNMNSVSVGLSACALADVGQAERAVPLLKRAIDLNPNNGHAWAALGSAQLILGDAPAAIINLSHGVAISPMDARLSVWISILALAHLRTGDIDGADAAARDALQADERNYMPRVVLAAVQLVVNDTKSARQTMQDCLRVKPDLSKEETTGLIGPKISATLWQLPKVSHSSL